MDLNGVGWAVFSFDGNYFYVIGYNVNAVSVWVVSDTSLVHQQIIFGYCGLNIFIDVAVFFSGTYVYVSSMCDYEVAILMWNETIG